jgi:phage-related protein
MEKIPVGVAYLQQKFEEAKPFIDRIWEAGVQLFDAFKASLPEVQKLMSDLTGHITGEAGPQMKSTFEIIIGIIQTMTKFWQEHGDEVLKVIDILINRVLPAIQAFGTIVNTTIEATLKVLTGDWAGAMEAMERNTAGQTKLVESIFGTTMANITKMIMGLPAKMIQAGRDIIQGIIKGFREKEADVYWVLQNIVNNAIARIKAALGIHSPSSTAAKQIGQPIGEGIAAGIWDALGSVQASLKGVTMEAVASVSPPSGAGGYSYSYAPTNTNHFSMTMQGGRLDAGSVAMGFSTLQSLVGGAG